MMCVPVALDGGPPNPTLPPAYVLPFTCEMYLSSRDERRGAWVLASLTPTRTASDQGRDGSSVQ